MAYEGPPDWQQQPGRWQPQQPGWQQAGYGPTEYPAPPPGYTGYGYPTPVSPGPRVAPLWIGAVMAIAGLAVVIGSFMTWAKAVAFDSSFSVAGTDGDRDGKITVVFGTILLVMGIVVLFRQGRLWTGVVGTVIATLCALTALADIGDISDKSAKSQPFGHIDVGPGLVLVLIAAVAALTGSIIAICVRRVSSS
ncbi:MAG TPA: hypothetical protein VE442_24340 [Jatrophihabitans sp.]|nr:hypothetical protein [Jatrophihabitans sp.]